MEVLWAPWRMDYILGPKPDACAFCIPAVPDEDRERLILGRAKHCFVIMNKFPYNSGHLMVAPYRHVGCLTDLGPEEASEAMRAVQFCVAAMHKAMKPQGVNVGVNLGEAAGAGIAAHLHIQIVPRWNGDSSFMAVFGETRVAPELIASTYDRLKPFFSEFNAAVAA